MFVTSAFCILQSDRYLMIHYMIVLQYIDHHRIIDVIVIVATYDASYRIESHHESPCNSRRYRQHLD